MAESPDTTQEEHGKTDQLLLKAKRQYQAACRGEDRLRKDMLDDRRFRLGRLRDESFQWPENVYIQRKQERRAVLQTNRMPAFVALARNAVLSAGLRPLVQPVDDKADVKTAGRRVRWVWQGTPDQGRYRLDRGRQHVSRELVPLERQGPRHGLVLRGVRRGDALRSCTMARLPPGSRRWTTSSCKPSIRASRPNWRA